MIIQSFLFKIRQPAEILPVFDQTKIARKFKAGTEADNSLMKIERERQNQNKLSEISNECKMPCPVEARPATKPVF